MSRDGFALLDAVPLLQDVALLFRQRGNSP
jgi:hypothetical protein